MQSVFENILSKIADIDSTTNHNIFKLYISFDGGAKKNGKPDCRAGWGYIVYNSDYEEIYREGGPTELKNIPGKVYKTSNNIAELSAFSGAINFVESLDNYLNEKIEKPVLLKVKILYDSEYAVKCITIWAPNWLKSPYKLKGKLNLDIILPTTKKYLELIERKSCINKDRVKLGAKPANINRINIEFKHVKSHKKEPENAMEKVYWMMNDEVDKYCTSFC